MRTQPLAFIDQPQLLLALDSVEHGKFVVRFRHVVLPDARQEPVGERDVVGGDVQERSDCCASAPSAA